MEDLAWLNWGFLDWNLVVQNWRLFLEGIYWTVVLSVAALSIGWVFSIPMAIARANRHPIFNGPIWCYTYFFRGTPLLVQAFLIYYGLGQFQVIQDSIFWPVLREAWACVRAPVGIQ